MLPRRLLLPAAATAALLAGCGGETPEDEVRGTLDRFAEAIGDKDYQTLCDDLFASDLVEQVRSVGLPCEVALRRGLGEVRSPQLTVGAVEVSGDQALAEVRTSARDQQPSQDQIRLVREEGGWRVASLAAPQPQPPAREEP